MGVTPAWEETTVLAGGDFVEIRAGGATALVATVWLRDNCPCPDCRHAGGQRIVDITSLPDAALRLERVRMRDDRLEVGWADGHASDFAVADIVRQRRDGDLPTPQLWTADSRLPGSFDAGRVAGDAAELERWLEAVHVYGFALLRGVPAREGALEDIVSLFGHVRETNYGRLFDVRVTADASNLAYTGLALGPHTDNPYRDPTPGIQLLHCIRADAGGGETTLVDGFAVAQSVRVTHPDSFALLHTTEVGFRYRCGGADLRATFPVLRLDSHGAPAEVRWNTRSCEPFRFDEGLVARYYRAYRAFGRTAADPRLVRRLALAPGDVVIMDNLRVLHGRTAIVSEGERHLQGCYADRDALRSRLRRLRREREG